MEAGKEEEVTAVATAAEVTVEEVTAEVMAEEETAEAVTAAVVKAAEEMVVGSVAVAMEEAGRAEAMEVPPARRSSATASSRSILPTGTSVELDSLRQPLRRGAHARRDARHLGEEVGAVLRGRGDAGLHLVLEAEAAVGWLDGHRQALDGRVEPLQVRELQVVGGEEGEGGAVLLHKLRDGPREAGPRAVRGAAAQLVEEHERRAAGPHVAEDVARLAHLAHEARRVGLERVRGGDAREDALQQRHLRVLGGDGAADVRHQADERHLPQVGGLARHVRSSDELQVARGGDEDVVWHGGVLA